MPALAPVFPLVPEMLAYCDDEGVIGSEFYVMSGIEGTILRRDVPAGSSVSTAPAWRPCATPRSTRSSLSTTPTS